MRGCLIDVWEHSGTISFFLSPFFYDTISRPTSTCFRFLSLGILYIPGINGALHFIFPNITCGGLHLWI